MKNKFAEKLKELRIESGLSQAELASKFHYTQSTLANWELGKRNPCYDTLIDISKFFNVSIDYLMGLED